VKNLKYFEASVLSGVLNATMNVRNTFAGHTNLRGRVEVWPDMEDVFVAGNMTIFSSHISIGDVVFRGIVAGVVSACLQHGSSLMVLVDVLAYVGEVSAHSARWRAPTSKQVWMASHVEVALAWYKEGNDLVVLR
jgi:hypothetical protein